MHISVEPREEYAVLHLRGEFDTYYVPLLQQEIDALIKAGVLRAVLDLRFVKFINSTALGAIIKASKQLSGRGGKLVISHPSVFCRDIIEKVGLDRVVNVFDSEEEAGAALLGGSKAASKLAEPQEESASTVLFTPVDVSRTEHFLSASRLPGKAPVTREKLTATWSGAGRMAGLDARGLRFTWSGGQTGLSPFAMAQLLAIGTEWKVKFRLPLLQRGYCEAVCTITEVEERPDGVKIAAVFKAIDDKTSDAIRQYAEDMAFLKDELRKATDH
jgi:anti-anti-sigma factor